MLNIRQYFFSNSVSLEIDARPREENTVAWMYSIISKKTKVIKTIHCENANPLIDADVLLKTIHPNACCNYANYVQRSKNIYL